MTVKRFFMDHKIRSSRIFIHSGESKGGRKIAGEL